MERQLDEFSTFVRYGEAISIIHKVKQQAHDFMDSQVLPRRPLDWIQTLNRKNTELLRLKVRLAMDIYRKRS